MEKAIRVVVYGKVQGIGYRNFVKLYAKMLNLKGYVRNLPEDKVEALFVGKNEDIEKMIEIMKTSHPLAKITKIKKEELEVQELNFNDFEILF